MVMMGKMVRSSFQTARRSSCSSSSEDGFIVFRGDSGVEYEGDEVASTIYSTTYSER